MRKSKVIAISILLIVTISCILTMYNKSYATETKDIPYGKGITGWNIYTEDIKVEIRENENQKIIIYASSETGYEITENVPNRFNIEWKMQDETIAKYTASEGEEIASGFVVAGSVEIEGLKAGTTKLLAKVTEKGNDKESLEFEIPITVYAKDENVIIGWDFSLNKKEMKMNVGSSDELMIFASTDYVLPQVLVKDYWDVEYKMEDETIAKYTAETGLETTSGDGIAAKAKIEGIKAGITKLFITVSKIGLRSNGEEYTESVKFEVPITVSQQNTNELEGWNITLNKENIAINPEETTEIIVNASLKDGYLTTQVVEEKFNVEWKIEDETVVKYIETKGQAITNQGIVGSAKIEGIKTGNTKLLITVKEKDSEKEYKKFEVPVTVKTKEIKKDKENDNSQAKKPIPQTGDNNLLIPIIVTGIIFIIVILKRKITYKD